MHIQTITEYLFLIYGKPQRRIFPYDCSAIHNATYLSKFSFVKWQYLGNVGCKVMIKSTVKNWSFKNRCSFKVSSPPQLVKNASQTIAYFSILRASSCPFSSLWVKIVCGGEPGSDKGCHQGGISVSWHSELLTPSKWKVYGVGN